ncbi:hypothetical protein ACJJTC_006685 [Scirpophaga incertulas]
MKCYDRARGAAVDARERAGLARPAQRWGPRVGSQLGETRARGDAVAARAAHEGEAGGRAATRLPSRRLPPPAARHAGPRRRAQGAVPRRAGAQASARPVQDAARRSSREDDPGGHASHPQHHRQRSPALLYTIFYTYTALLITLYTRRILH